MTMRVAGRWIRSLLVLCAGLSLSAGVALAAPATAPQAGRPTAAARLSPAAPELTKADLDAWMDGFIGRALEREDIAGVEVVIVRDGQVLTARGFGYADRAARTPVDAQNTLFRPGSISKLFTWTAVMQLVDQGRIDLDADINRYIDFQIPPYGGRPVTMRDIMTHTTGFADVIKGGIRASGPVPPLGVVVKRMLPDRVFAPGTTPAYSNYATALAGYVVERVSGEPYELYIQRHIFQPLGMSHSTFEQPLPRNLAPLMSKGYETASGEAKPFELISVPPAGGASISGGDMAKFMIAQLGEGGGLISPRAARVLHTPNRVVLPGLNRMALGFYEQRLNGISAIGHGGDLGYFHSYLWLLPDQKIGIYLTMNSAGADGQNFPLRLNFFQAFGDRYFPAPQGPLRELPTAKAHARLLAGSYSESRRAFTTFLDIADFLGQTRIGIDKDGRPRVPNLFGGAPRTWIEVAPFVWQDAYGAQRLSARVEQGRVVCWSVDSVAPFMVWERTPWPRDAAWLRPMALFGLGVTVITALAWPARAIARKAYGVTLALTAPDLALHRLLHALAWLTLAVMGGWLLVLKGLSSMDADLDLAIRSAEALGAIAFIGWPAAALWSATRSWTSPESGFVRLWSTLRVVGASALLWVAAVFHLLTFGVSY